VYDNRRPNPDTILAWVTASGIGRWTFQLALDAIHAHYARSREFVMPADITAYVRAERVQPARELPPPDAEPAAPERVRALVGELAGKLGWRRDDEPADRHAVLAVACPWCHAPAGEPCSRPSERNRAGRVRLARFHPARVEAAGVTA
jgi:hypothetical protein